MTSLRGRGEGDRLDKFMDDRANNSYKNRTAGEIFLLASLNRNDGGCQEK